MILSAAAGGLGALAGAVGKLSLSHDSATALAVTSLCYRAMRTAPSDINSICLGFGHASRFLGLAAMLSLNALMVKLFLQALTAKRSTAAVTLISTATNFAITVGHHHIQYILYILALFVVAQLPKLTTLRRVFWGASYWARS
jgi:hypothetical protein